MASAGSSANGDASARQWPPERAARRHDRSYLSVRLRPMEGSAASRLPGLRQRAESRAVDAAARAYARLRPRTRALLLRGPQRPLVLRRIFKAMERQLDPERGARANV